MTCNRALWMAVTALALVGCSEVDKGEGDEADSGAPVAVTCPEGELSWDLVELWSHEGDANSLVAGRQADTNGDGHVTVADDASVFVLGWSRAVRLDATGGDEVVLQDAYRLFGRLADVDDSPGVELVSTWYNRGEEGENLSIFRADDSMALGIPADWISRPWLADIDDDGELDVAMEGGIVDLATGDTILAFEDNDSWDHEPVAVDLDLDGQVELLAALSDGAEIGILDPDSEVVTNCLTSLTENPVMFAVGNLDDDHFGEFVAAGQDFIAVCDHDSSLLASVETSYEQVALVGIGDLDGDGAAEIILSGQDGYGQLSVFDASLEPLWARTGDNGWLPFSLADLDADGDHELLVANGQQLLILDGDGTMLASHGEPGSASAWRAQPVAVDLDGDGLAEVLFSAKTHVLALETTTGGFPVRGADVGWSGIDHFPGLVDVEGSLDVTGGHWRAPGGNVWNGHPACVR